MDSVTLAKTLIKNEEGLKLVAYLCPAGHWTIGYGSCFVYGHPVQAGMTTTQAQAEQLLDDRVRSDMVWINIHCKQKLSNNQMAALLDFTYNFNVNDLATSVLWSKIQTGDFQGAANQFLRWDHAKNPHTGQMVEMEGLLERRLKDKELFAA